MSHNALSLADICKSADDIIKFCDNMRVTIVSQIIKALTSPPPDILEAVNISSPLSSTIKESKNEASILSLLLSPSIEDDIGGIVWKNLSIDDTCTCNMGQLSSISRGKCLPCLMVSRISDFASDHFHIQCGKYTNSKLIVKRGTVGPISIKPNKSLGMRSELVLKQMDGRCEASAKNKVYYQADLFTNSFIQGWFVQKIMEESKLPHFIHIYLPFICRGQGFVLQQYTPSLQEIVRRNASFIAGKEDANSSLIPDISRNLFIQLVVIFTQLRKINFVAQDAILLFDDNFSFYHYEDMTVQCPITLMLDKLHHCSCTPAQNSAIIAPTSHIADVVLPHVELSLQRDTRETSAEVKNGVERGGIPPSNFYQYTDIYFTHARRIGIPLFTESYNLYYFLVMLMREPLIYRSVTTDSKLLKLFSLLWKETEVSTVMSRISDSKIDMENILQGISLRCDILSYMQVLLKNEK